MPRRHNVSEPSSVMGLYQSDFGAAPFLRPEFQSADGLSLQCKWTQNEESFWVHLRVEPFCSLGRIYLRLRNRVIPSGEYLREKRILGIGSPNYPPIKTVGNIEDVVFGIRELRKKREGVPGCSIRFEGFCPNRPMANPLPLACGSVECVRSVSLPLPKFQHASCFRAIWLAGHRLER